MFSIGLTGGIGSGKSTVAALLGERGAAVVDADAVAHQLTVAHGAAMPAILASFGASMADVDGALDRAAMRERVFDDPAARRQLEQIIHPLIRTRVDAAAAAAWGAGAAYVVLAIPLLVESGNWKQRVDRVLVVDCTEEQQRIRVRSRSELTDDSITRIMATQATRLQRLEAADDIIVNASAESDLAARVERLHNMYCALASAARAQHARSNAQRV